MGSRYNTWASSLDNAKQAASEERARQFLAAGARLVPSRSALRGHGRSGMLRGEAWLRSRCGVGHSAIRAVRVVEGLPKTVMRPREAAKGQGAFKKGAGTASSTRLVRSTVFCG